MSKRQPLDTLMREIRRAKAQRIRYGRFCRRYKLGIDTLFPVQAHKSIQSPYCGRGGWT